MQIQYLFDNTFMNFLFVQFNQWEVMNKYNLLHTQNIVFYNLGIYYLILICNLQSGNNSSRLVFKIIFFSFISQSRYNLIFIYQKYQKLLSKQVYFTYLSYLNRYQCSLLLLYLFHLYHTYATVIILILIDEYKTRSCTYH